MEGSLYQYIQRANLSGGFGHLSDELCKPALLTGCGILMDNTAAGCPIYNGNRFVERFLGRFWRLCASYVLDLGTQA